MDNNLDEEYATYLRMKPELLSHIGKYVLIYGQDVAGIYDTLEDAYEAGVRLFRPDVFFVKKILDYDPGVSIPILLYP